MTSFNTDQCPKCFRPSRIWRERPEHGSRELFWVGCKVCGQVAGGLSDNIARQNWTRLVERLKANLIVLRQPLGVRYDGLRA